jgi:hypothetical protein
MAHLLLKKTDHAPNKIIELSEKGIISGLVMLRHLVSNKSASAGKRQRNLCPTQICELSFSGVITSRASEQGLNVTHLAESHQLVIDGTRIERSDSGYFRPLPFLH